MKAALIHLATRETPVATLKAALPLIEQAAQEGAQLVLLPELFPSGYRYPDAAATPQVLEALQTSARQHQMVILAGVLEQAGERYANRVRILGPQGELGCYTKTHLIPAFGEPETMIPGQALVRLGLEGFQAGVAICFDLRFPELFRTYAVGGVTLFLVPSAWPMSRSYAWELFCKARAAENQAYLLAVNHAEEPFGAASLAVDPLGMELARLEVEGVRVVELDPTYPHRLRQEFPLFSQRRPDLYKL
ncbi:MULTISPECIES: nitrilase-related carbon-nitrogen hydrolase [unclassified Meiothermus]|uniref:nitrilase-related carbon-nitrogen hydrolase n=1 Tax=unclassified Meiothermus TaxID=370471 RepID=UPI000D7BAFA3|nr:MULTISPECIES: nitrilase-related carbon-nitrogen hydrolase [unclassified Meiothermus]PZA08736.1 nitrilase [Meiothermus sp. Pnk-1]RYM40644.1 nitrilase [Meiothermus sp. PNK-Is4]